MDSCRNNNTRAFNYRLGPPSCQDDDQWNCMTVKRLCQLVVVQWSIYYHAHRLIKITERMLPIPRKFHLSCGMCAWTEPRELELARSVYTIQIVQRRVRGHHGLGILPLTLRKRSFKNYPSKSGHESSFPSDKNKKRQIIYQALPRDMNWASHDPESQTLSPIWKILTPTKQKGTRCSDILLSLVGGC